MTSAVQKVVVEISSSIQMTYSELLILGHFKHFKFSLKLQHLLLNYCPFLIAVLQKEMIWRPSNVFTLLKATYAWPGANIFDKSTTILYAVIPGTNALWIHNFCLNLDLHFKLFGSVFSLTEGLLRQSVWEMFSYSSWSSSFQLCIHISLIWMSKYRGFLFLR